MGQGAAEAKGMGILSDRTYCVIVAGDMMNSGRLMRLRGFAGDPEWNGKWSDNDKAWTNMLRQQLAYSKDGDDGTFWIQCVRTARPRAAGRRRDAAPRRLPIASRLPPCIPRAASRITERARARPCVAPGTLTSPSTSAARSRRASPTTSGPG